MAEEPKLPQKLAQVYEDRIVLDKLVKHWRLRGAVTFSPDLSIDIVRKFFKEIEEPV